MDETGKPARFHRHPRPKVLRSCLASLMAIAGLFTAPTANALDWNAPVAVTIIEVTYVPDMIGFQASSTVGACPAGSWLRWYPRGSDQASKIANIQAVLSTLMTAKTGNKRVMIFGDNANCTVQFIYLID